MPIYTDSKGLPPDADGNDGQTHPDQSTVTAWGRLEPLLTPAQLKTRFLAGIPLVSKLKDPVTGKAFKFTDEILNDYIKLALNDAEVETGLIFAPTKFAEKLPYIRQDFNNFGHLKVTNRPVATVDRLAAQLPDNNDIFEFPLTWVETANLTKGQINIIPLAIIGNGTNQVVSGSGTGVFFNNLVNQHKVPALIMVEYTAGFKDGLYPTVVNQLIGCMAATQVLSQLAATYAKATSTSLSIDGLSQGISGPGPQVFQTRIMELEQKKDTLIRKLRKIFGSNFVIGDV